MTDLDKIWLTGRVQRYHTHPQLASRGQTNADHQWGVVSILLILHPNPSLSLIHAAHFHDAGEQACGDLPAHFKNREPDFSRNHAQLEREALYELGILSPALTPDDFLWLKFADRLESFLYMQHNGVPWSAEGFHELLDYVEALGVNFNLNLNPEEETTKWKKITTWLRTNFDRSWNATKTFKAKWMS